MDEYRLARPQVGAARWVEPGEASASAVIHLACGYGYSAAYRPASPGRKATKSRPATLAVEEHVDIFDGDVLCTVNPGQWFVVGVDGMYALDDREFRSWYEPAGLPERCPLLVGLVALPAEDDAIQAQWRLILTQVGNAEAGLDRVKDHLRSWRGTRTDLSKLPAAVDDILIKLATIETAVEFIARRSVATPLMIEQ